MSAFIHLNVANAWPDFTTSLNLAVEPASGALRLKKTGGVYARAGAFVSGKLTIGKDPVPWFRVHASMGPLAKDEHVELFTFASNGAAPAFAIEGATPFATPGWNAAPRDLHDVMVPGPGATALWVGGVLRGSGTSSPAVEQIRVDYARETAIDALPAVYRRDVAARERLERLLALFETPLREMDRAIADLPRLFDPSATPGGPPPAWLSWLSAWLDFDLTDRWSEETAREMLAGAFELYGARGTIEGLRRYLKIYAGVEARIHEPAAATRVWSLGQSSTLGFTTQLAAGSASGAILDTTATLDASHLTASERFGAPLFEDVAHRFCVEIYCADLRSPRTLADVRGVLDREKPAHTTYSLRVMEPRMRVAVQARVGIDTIVASHGRKATLGTVLGAAVLAEAQTPCESATEP